MNEERVLAVLDAYDGTLDSMQAVAGIFTEELGENWTDTIFAELPAISRDEKKKLKHLVNYYAATLAWNEAQEYLSQVEALNVQEVSERIPVLQQWLEFFGQVGRDLVAELQKKLNEQYPQNVNNQPAEDEDERQNQSVAEPETWAPSEHRILEDGKLLTGDEIDTAFGEQEKAAEKSESEAEPEPVPDSPEVFAIRKVITEVDLLKGVQSWLSARCNSLHDIEIYAYPFFGFVVDLLRQTLKDMESLEEKTECLDLLDRVFPEGHQGFDNAKAAIQNDIALAEQNCESSVTALISDSLGMDAVRDALGPIDDSAVEYIGPPPEGFEALDMDTPLDEAAIKAEYAKIENKNVEEELGKKNNDGSGTSQSTQKGTQRKLSFSLKNKKSTGGAT